MNAKNPKGKKAQNTKSEEQETQWTDMTDNKAMEEEEDKEESEEEYEVEVIVDKMIKKGTVFYKVKWKNYSLDDCTWEPEANLDNCPLKIREYENQLLAKTKEKAAETPKEVPKEVPNKPEIKTEEAKAEEPASQEKKSIKKGTSNKPAAVNLSVEPESITGKRDRQLFEEEKAKAEEKTAKARKEKSGKKKNEETADKDKTSQAKIINKSEPQPEVDEESISKMRKLSPKSSGQPESQVTQTKDGSGNIKGINSGADSYPPPVKYASKDLSHQTSIEKQQIEKIYDEVFAKAKQGQPTGGKNTSSDQHPPSQTKGSNAMPEEKDSKVHSSIQSSQSGQQELNKGISLSKIMQDEKLMEMSETESRSEAQENEKKNQGSETSPFDDKSGSKSKKKARSEYGALEKGDIPLKVVGIRPVKEDKDLEIMISWKTREDGVKPYNSKVMRIDLLRSGFYMPLIEFYESKMKLEGAPTFDPGMLPKV